MFYSFKVSKTIHFEWNKLSFWLLYVHNHKIDTDGQIRQTFTLNEVLFYVTLIITLWPSFENCQSTSVWPDSAKFHHFGEIFKIYCNFIRVKLVFGKLFNLLWKIQCAFGPLYDVVNGQILSKHFRHLVTLVHLNQSHFSISSLSPFLTLFSRHSKENLTLLFLRYFTEF